MYCPIFFIVVRLKLCIRNDPQKAKVTQEQSSNVSCTSTSISAIHSVMLRLVLMVNLHCISLFVVSDTQ